MIEQLVMDVITTHWPRPPLPMDEQQRLLSAVPFAVPGDVAYFYSRCNGAILFERGKSRYAIVGLERFRRTRFDIFGHDDEALGPSGLLTICDVQDGKLRCTRSGESRGDRVSRGGLLPRGFRRSAV